MRRSPVDSFGTSLSVISQDMSDRHENEDWQLAPIELKRKQVPRVMKANPDLKYGTDHEGWNNSGSEGCLRPSMPELR
jgi:hypothetical protein